MIVFKCIECGKKLKIPEEHAGKRAKCPQCRAVMDVPLKSNLDENVPSVTDAQNTTQPPLSGDGPAKDGPVGAKKVPLIQSLRNSLLRGWRFPAFIAVAIVLGIGLIVFMVVLITSLSTPEISVSDIVNNFDNYAGREVEMDVVIVKNSWGRIEVRSSKNAGLGVRFIVEEKMYKDLLSNRKVDFARVRIRVKIYDKSEIEKKEYAYYGVVKELVFQ